MQSTPAAKIFYILKQRRHSLKAQVCVAKGMVKKSEKVVTTPEDVLQLLHPMESAFHDIYRFIQLVLTLHVLSAQAERSFPASNV